MRYLQNSGILKKKYEKSHFMFMFGELLVCILQKQGRFSLFIPFGKKAIEFCKYLR